MQGAKKGVLAFLRVGTRIVLGSNLKPGLKSYGSRRVGGSLKRFAAAGVIFLGFAVYLYQPYFQKIKAGGIGDFLIVFNCVFAGVGCYVLSRRWVGSFAGSFFAGLIYGFGPFFLGLGVYHPTAGSMAALIPWLFCLSAFGPRGGLRWVRIALAILPFAAILVFFQVSGYLRFFPVPIQSKLHFRELVGLIAPLATSKRGYTDIGFYHISIGPLIIGLSMMVAARRVGSIIICVVGIVLAFCGPVFEVSPIIWWCFPMLGCAVLSGEGIQGLIFAGFNDRKWIMLVMICMLTLAVVTLLAATKFQGIFAGLGKDYAKVLLLEAKIYILGAVVMAILFFMARAKIRLQWLRIILVCSAIGTDIFLSAGFINDMVF